MTIIKDDVNGKYKKLSKFVPRQFPLYVREKYPNLVNFVQHYYKWLEMDGNVINEIYNLPNNFNIETARDEFLDFFVKEYAPTLPNDIVADKKILLQHIKQFYLAKGTASSIEFLFRVLYNESIEVNYPGENILRCSDGIWSKKTILKTTSSTKIDIIGRKIFGTSSGAVAIVDKVTTNRAGEFEYNILELSNMNGVFLSNETIQTRDNLQPYFSIVSGQIWKVETLENGNGYTEGESIPLFEYSLSNANIKIETTDDGVIKTFNIQDSGVGYTNTFTMYNVNGKGAVLKFYVGGVYYTNGVYEGQQGLISGTCVIQDGFKYQPFSYVIKSNIPIKSYINTLKSTVHPAGLLMLANTEIVNSISNITTMSSLDAEITIN